MLSICVDYGVGIGLERFEGQAPRRWLLTLSLTLNLGVLATFKYFDFFRASLEALANSAGWQLDWPTLHLVLPIGISFYTFQTLSYSVDVYRGKLSAERNWLRFATYVIFFPQLVAGPIVRAAEFLPQLLSDRTWSFDQCQRGIGLMLLGFFKKLVIADNIGSVVDHLFDNPAIYTAVNAAMVMALYAFQIYGDFSGYSDIAIGVALLMGFVFPVNFRFPYFANSFSDFWRRWHITLSTWLRDYVYIPLGGNRGSRLATARNLMVTMLLGGLWHGANWTFVVWGGLHGGFLVVQRLWRWHFTNEPTDSDRPTSDFSSILADRTMATVAIESIKIALVFVCVCLTWVIFRSADLVHVVRVLEPLAGFDGLNPSSLRDRIPLVKCCLLVSIMFTAELFVFVGGWAWLVDRLKVARMLGYAGLLWMIALFGAFEGQSFIYFQF
jgi:D-alanyl-lipoteichoic acid acyltransferase DltB (MBOAT superfamily)